MFILFSSLSKMLPKVGSESPKEQKLTPKYSPECAQTTPREPPQPKMTPKCRPEGSVQTPKRTKNHEKRTKTTPPGLGHRSPGTRMISGHPMGRPIWLQTAIPSNTSIKIPDVRGGGVPQSDVIIRPRGSPHLKGRIPVDQKVPGLSESARRFSS